MEIKQRRLAVEPRITLAELAELSGITARGINKIENGLVNNPGIKTVEAIEAALVTLEKQRAQSGHSEPTA